MFSLFRRLVIAVEKIASNSISKEEYLSLYLRVGEAQKQKMVEVLNMQIEHSQKELLFRAEYKRAKELELTIDEQLALERLERDKIALEKKVIIENENNHLLIRAFGKKANGIPLTEVESMAIESYENQKQIKGNI